MKAIPVEGENMTIEAIGALLMKHYPDIKLKLKKSSQSVVLKKSFWTHVVVTRTRYAIQIRTKVASWVFICFGGIGFFFFGLISLLLGGGISLISYLFMDKTFGDEVGEIIEKNLDSVHFKEEENFFKDKYDNNRRIARKRHKYKWLTFLYNILAIVFIWVSFILLDPHYYYYTSAAEEDLVCRQDEQTGKYGFVDKQGKWMIKPVFDERGSFYHCSFAATKFNNLPCVIDKSGNIVCIGEAENDSFVLYRCSNEITEVIYYRENKSLYGGLNEAGQLVVPLVYNYLKVISENIIACEIRDVGSFYYDNNGNEVSNFLTLRHKLTHRQAMSWILMLPITLLVLNIVRYTRYHKKRKSGLIP